jgi:CelD/BcsL family acetyltransferase involved in cellulose biosynthesis
MTLVHLVSQGGGERTRISFPSDTTPGEVRPAGVTYERISSESAFAELGHSWDDLVRALPRPSPFLLHTWLVGWYRHFGRGSELAIQAAFRDGSLVAAFPLVHRRWRGLRVGKFLGGDLSSLADLLLSPSEDPSTAAALIERAAAQHDFAELFAMCDGSNVVKNASPQDLRLFRRADGPVLELTDDWDALYERKLSAKRRRSLRRRGHQLRKVGRMEFACARSREDVEAALDDCFRLHALRWAGRTDRSGFATGPGVSFHRAVLPALADQDVIRLSTLRLNGRPIAFALAFAVAGRLYCYRMAFDPSFARSSPGLRTLHELLAWASREGLRRVEFMGTGERFKLDLADGLEPLYLGLGLAGSAQGRAMVGARSGVRHLRERLGNSPTVRRAYDRARPLLARVERPRDALGA